MTSVRIPPVLAGATALALLMSSAAIAQQQQSTDQQTQTQAAQQQGSQAQASGSVVAVGSGSQPLSGQMQQTFDQVDQLLQQARQTLEQNNAATARDALQQASRILQQPAVNADGQQQRMTDLQAQLQKALDAIDGNDMQSAQAAVADASSALQALEQDSQQAQRVPSQQGESQTDQTASALQGNSQGGQTTSSMQGASQGMAQQPPMQQGEQMSQESLLQLRDQLDMARLDLQSAMDSVEQARRALDNAQPGMAAAGQTDVTVIEGGDTAQATQPRQDSTAAAQGDRAVPRLSQEETQKLLGIGDRQIGEASEVVTVSVGDLENRDVISYDGEKIGEVGKIVTNGGQTFAIVEHGGFLGIGENKVAVPLDRLGMRGKDIVLLGLTEKQMKALPDYNYDSGQEMSKNDSIEIGRYE